MTSDAFGLDDVPRNHQGRPLIVPPGGGKPVPYTRVSNLAKTLDDSEKLTAWKVRTALKGLVQRRDLAALIATTEDRDTLDGYAEQCIEAGGGTEKRNLGTALHSMAEAVDRGAPIEVQPIEWQPWIVAYRDALAAAGLRPVAREVFLVNDEVQAAGTADTLLLEEDSGLVYPADMKTGGVYVGATQMQVATYARSFLYDHRTGTRYPLNINIERGILIHLPQDSPEPACHLIELDLIEGWRDVQTALEVRAARRKRSGGGVWRPTASLPKPAETELTFDDVELTIDSGAEDVPIPARHEPAPESPMTDDQPDIICDECGGDLVAEGQQQVYKADVADDKPWTRDRPATTIAGRDLVPDPGANANRFNGATKSRNDGVRVTVQEAALLQSFPADHPWQGTKTKQFQQVGNAIPPLLAKAILEAVIHPAQESDR